MNLFKITALFACLLFLASCSSSSKDDLAPNESVNDAPGVSDPGTSDPGTSDPGTSDPGASDPGTSDPGTSKPGASDPGTSGPGTLDPPDNDATSILNGDNYILLLNIAARSTLRDYQTVIREAEGVVDSFPPVDGPFATFDIIHDCPLGGTASDMGEGDSVLVEGVRTYSNCASNIGTLNGTVVVVAGFFDSGETDVTLTNYGGSQSFLSDVETIVLNSSFDAPNELVSVFELTTYTETSSSQMVTIEGSGGRMFDDVGTENGYRFNGTLSLGMIDSSEVLDTEIAASAVLMDASGALETGSIEVLAVDGSSAVVVPGDTAGTVNITRSDSNGSDFTETLPWTDIYP